jgi:hypothetical protein
MRTVKHDTATCPDCGTALWFGTNSEGSGWAVYYECADCQFERRAGRVTMEETDSRDALWDRAEKMGERF